jgi:hypothetical protein
MPLAALALLQAGTSASAPDGGSLELLLQSASPG